MNLLTYRTSQRSFLIRKEDERMKLKGNKKKPMPNRIEDMSPLPQSPRKGANKFQYGHNTNQNGEFKLNLNK